MWACSLPLRSDGHEDRWLERPNLLALSDPGHAFREQLLPLLLLALLPLLLPGSLHFPEAAWPLLLLPGQPACLMTKGDAEHGQAVLWSNAYDLSQSLPWFAPVGRPHLLFTTSFASLLLDWHAKSGLLTDGSSTWMGLGHDRKQQQQQHMKCLERYSTVS